MKTAVDTVTKRNGRVVNARFFAMTAHVCLNLMFAMWPPVGKKALLKRMCFDSRRSVRIDAKTQILGSFG
jgi:hypothetical protein